METHKELEIKGNNSGYPHNFEINQLYSINSQVENEKKIDILLDGILTNMNNIEKQF